MAKALQFVKEGNTYSLSPTKIERKKLYGWTEVRVRDSEGNVCRQVGLASNGITIVPKGGTKVGMLCEDGNWMEKDELEALHADGTKAEPVPSSFDGVISLDQKVSPEYLLDHLITSVYQLDGEGAAELAAIVGDDIYAFPFSYRGGFDTADGMLLSNGTVPFIFVGEKGIFEMIGLDEQGFLDADDDEEDEDEELDFGMF